MIDSFYTGNGSYLNYSITSAAINTAGNRVVLLGYDKCWIFSAFNGRNFFKGKVNTYAFNGLSQKEGVYFENDYRLLFTQEKSILGAAGMYRVALPQISSHVSRESKGAQFEIEAYPNPVDETMQLLIRSKLTGKLMEVCLFDVSGKKIKTWELQSNTMHEIDISEIASGTYFIRLADGSTKKIIKE